MDIEGLGERTVDLLLDANLLSSPADLYRLSEEELEKLPRMGPVAAHNLVSAIAGSRERPLHRLLAALNIRHVGESAARALAQHFGMLDALRTAASEELEAVPGVGPVLATSIADFFRRPEAASLVENLAALGVQMTEPREEPRTGPFEGETVVVTGTLTHYSRAEAEEIVRRAGGRVAQSVSSRTTLVVAGENAGSKLTRAQELGVPVMGEEEFEARATNLAERWRHPTSEATEPSQ
jgi:DNA ligase (NAD+)